MLTWQDFLTYVRTLLRWWAVLALAAALAAGTAWQLTRKQPDYYRAQASLMVGNNFSVTLPDRFAVDVSNSLARYYEVLAHREVILGPVAEKLGLSFPWQLIADRMLYTEINPQANLLEILVTDSNPERAAAIANAIGEELIAYSPTAPEKVAAQQAEVDRQIEETQATIAQLDQRIEELKQRQGQLNAAVDLRENQSQIDELEAARTSSQEAYNSLLNLRNNSSINTLSFFERAEPPAWPLPQRHRTVIGGAALGGLLVAAVAILLLDLLDERWRPGPDLERRMGINFLGSVRFGAGSSRRDAPRPEKRDVHETHTRMVLAANGRPPRMVLVSSPEPSEERSAYSIDLAGTYGHAGHRVLLVDAEMANSPVTRLIAEREAAVERPQVNGAIERWSRGGANGYNIPPELWVRLRPTPLANVALLPGRGGAEPLPVLVPLLHWPELVRSLSDVADVIIFDGPSALGSADAALLAQLVDGVVLVLDPAEDSRAQVAESRRRVLNNPGARLLGAVTVSGGARRRLRARRPAFGIAVDRGGVTITLPARRDGGPTPPLLEEHAGGDRETAVHESAQPDGWGVLRPDDQMRERAVGGPAVIITPPPTPGPTVIITPPPAPAARGRRAGAPRPTRRTSRAGAGRARGSTRAAAAEEGEDA